MRVRSVQFLDVYEAQLAAQRLIQGAAVDVYWSAWLLDFRAAFGAGTTAERLLKETRAEVNVLAFDNPKDVGGVPDATVSWRERSHRQARRSPRRSLAAV
jgi:hypothetical protein